MADERGADERGEERRTNPLFVKFRPSVAAQVRADATKRGQPLVEWMERAALDRLRERETGPAE